MNTGPCGQPHGDRPSASGPSSSSEAPLPGIPVSYGPETPFRPPARPVGPQEPREPTSLEAPPPRKPPARQTTGTERPVPMEDDDEDLTGSADNPTSGAAASSGSASSSRKAPLQTASVPTRRLRAKTDISSEAPNRSASEEPTNLEKRMKVNFVGLTQEDYLNCLEQGDAFLEIEIPISDSQALRNFLEKPSSYRASQARKSRVEVSVRRLDADQQAKFDVARKKEIDEWLAAEAIKVVSKFGVPEDRVMKMRFVYTWKSDGRAYARLVLQGFTDPDLEMQHTDAPTISKRGRSLFLAACARNKFWVEKADVIGAFLQGTASEESMQVYGNPPPELAQALGVRTGDWLAQVLKPAYGLTVAPRRWWQLWSVRGTLWGGYMACDTVSTMHEWGGEHTRRAWALFR